MHLLGCLHPYCNDARSHTRQMLLRRNSQVSVTRKGENDAVLHSNVRQSSRAFEITILFKKAPVLVEYQ